MMTITIVTQSIIEDMKIKAHLEVQKIQNLKERDDARIDDEDMDEVNRDIVSASASLAKILQRFLSADSENISGGALSLPSTIEYELEFTSRRESGKEQQLADIFHAYLVDNALSRFFRSVSQFELASSHEALAREEEKNITEIINHKSAPIWQD